MLKVILLILTSITAFPFILNLNKSSLELDEVFKFETQKTPSSSLSKNTLKDDSTLKELNYSGTNLKAIPTGLDFYSSLERLDLSKNRELELNQSFIELAKIKTLTELDLSQCDLAYIPFSINEIQSLEIVNFSHNYIFEIPDMMHKMHKLKHVDLSNNKLKELGYAPSLWKDLESINLNDNPELDLEKAFKSLSFLKNIEQIKVNKIAVLPQNTVLLKAKELIFEECSFKKSDLEFAANSKLTSIVFDNCDETKFNKILPSISTNKKLEQLVLTNNDLKRLSIDSIQFPNLKNLDISGNNINEKDLSELQKQFPNCKIQTGTVTENANIPEKREIEAPFEQAVVEPSVFSITSDKEQVLTTSTSKITVPKDAFLDKNGKVVTTPVAIEYKEILNPVDQILSGIPMEYDSAGVTYNFESAGMIDFRAESNGEEVFPNPKAQIKVELNSEFTDTDYGLYSMDDEYGKWDYIQPAKQKEEGDSSNSSWSSIKVNKAKKIKMPVFKGKSKPTIGYNTLKFHFNNYDKNQFFIKQEYSGYTHRLKNSSLNFIRKSKLRMENKHWKECKKGFKKFYKKEDYVHKVDSTDLFNNICFGYDFKVNKEKDIYELSINYIDTSLTIACTLIEKHNLYTDQKSNLRFWKKLKKTKLKESRENKKVIKKYKLAMNEYEKELKIYQKALREYTELNKDMFKNEDKVLYALRLSAFNTWNCDRYDRNNRGVKIKAAFKKVGKAVFIPISIYIINKTKNGYIRSNTTNSFTYEKNCNHSLLLVDKDGNMGLVDVESFKKGVKKDGLKKVFETEFLAKDDINREELLVKLL